jgi:hypothetical protein
VVSWRCLLAACGLAVCGCSLLVPVDDLQRGSLVPPPDASGDDGGSCGADLTRDRNNCGRCGHACGGAECVASLCQPLVVARAQKPLGIGLWGTSVFWVNQLPQGLYRADKDGRNAMPLQDPADQLQEPFDIASDGMYVYWTDLGQNWVYRKKLIGSPKEEFATGPGLAAFLVLDGDTVYVTDYRPPTRGVIEGGTKGNVKVLYSESDVVAGLAVFGSDAYWPRQGMMRIASGRTTDPNQMTSIIAETGPQAMGVAVDDSFVYWVEERRRVVRAPRIGGGPKLTLYESEPFGDSDIAVDDQWLYWTEHDSGFVRRMRK